MKIAGTLFKHFEIEVFQNAYQSFRNSEKNVGSVFLTHLLQYRYSLVKVVMFHSRRRIYSGKWRFGVRHEFVVLSSMVQIVA